MDTDEGLCDLFHLWMQELSQSTADFDALKDGARARVVSELHASLREAKRKELALLHLLECVTEKRELIKSSSLCARNDSIRGSADCQDDTREQQAPDVQPLLSTPLHPLGSGEEPES